MRSERGRHFDPRLVDLFLENVGDVEAVRERYTPQPAQPTPA
jgi:response regulator RpfG family c-di-GMP phosphodiesterase